MSVELSLGNDFARIQVKYHHIQHFFYEIRVRIFEQSARPYQVVHYTKDGKLGIYEGSLQSGTHNLTVENISKDEIISNFFKEFKSRIS